jgi:hypothetical protein
MFWIAFFAGMLFGPAILVAALWLLRDLTPPILFMPSDWD